MQSFCKRGWQTDRMRAREYANEQHLSFYSDFVFCIQLIFFATSHDWVQCWVMRIQCHPIQLVLIEKNSRHCQNPHISGTFANVAKSVACLSQNECFLHFCNGKSFILKTILNVNISCIPKKNFFSLERESSKRKSINYTKLPTRQIILTQIYFCSKNMPESSQWFNELNATETSWEREKYQISLQIVSDLVEQKLEHWLPSPIGALININWNSLHQVKRIGR